MKTWTPEEVLAERPDVMHLPGLATGFWEGHGQMSLLEILTVLPFSDFCRVWLAARPGALPGAVREKWGSVIVERAIRRARVVCESSEWLAWAENWVDGIDRSGLAAQRAAGIAIDDEVAFYAAQAAYQAARGEWWGVAQAAVWQSYWNDDLGCNAGAEEFRRQVADLVAMKAEWE